MKEPEIEQVEKVQRLPPKEPAEMGQLVKFPLEKDPPVMGTEVAVAPPVKLPPLMEALAPDVETWPPKVPPLKDPLVSMMVLE